MNQRDVIQDCLRFTLASLMLMSTQAFSDPQEATFYDHVEWAKHAPASAYSDPNMTINLSDFCASDDPDCINDIHNPEEAGMNDTEISDKSTTEFYSNDSAKAIQDNFDNNSYTLDPNDDTYRFATLGIDNAYEITHGQSNQFVDCQSGSQCLIEYSERTCTAPTYNSVPCFSEPVATVDVGTTHYQCPNGWTLKGTTCHGEVQECRYDSKNKVQDNNSYASCSGSFTTTYLWNGKKPTDLSRYSKGPLVWSGGGSYCTSWTTREYEICGPAPVEEPAGMTCDEGYTLSGAQCIKNTFSWKSECSLPGECSQVEKLCIDGADTRIVNGIPTYLDCWKYQLNHVCDLPNGCQSLPQDCEAKTESTNCSLELNGVCVEQSIPHVCATKQCSETSLLCGEDSFCLDGDCFEEMPTTDDSFDESLSALAALGEAAEGIGDPPMIFTGQAMKCTDKAFGFADCCKDGGWGTGIGLDECNEQEKALGQAKEQGVTIYLGSYCASSVLGACTRKKKTYCVFDSKLARIIQQQGVKGQLGIGLGSAKNPICGAITPEQLQDIDFELIDFSDFYGDMHDNTNLPSEEEIKDRITSAYGD